MSMPPNRENQADRRLSLIGRFRRPGSSSSKQLRFPLRMGVMMKNEMEQRERIISG